MHRDNSLPWYIEKFDEIFASTSEQHHGVSILSADGETVIAQRVTPEHAEMIVRAVNAMFTH